MLLKKPKSRPPSRGPKAQGGCDDRPDAWKALDRLIGEMQGSARRSRHLRLTLQAIREGIGADVVYLYEPSEVEGMEIVGGRGLSPAWYHEFARGLLADRPDAEAGSLLRPGPVDEEDEEGPMPSPPGAALVRLSRSRQAWIVALSFGPARAFRPHDLEIIALAKRLLIAQGRHAEIYEDLKETLFGLVQCLSATIDAKDPYTAGHSERVARIAVRLGEEMGLPSAELSDLYLAGLLHDVGKIGIRDDVLRKPGRLTDEEMDHIREHPAIGDRIIATVKKLDYLRPGVRNHHERYDGQGYPDGLAGERIPRIARILAVADSCDAMMSSRRYRAAMPPDRINAIMAQGAGTQWDPRIVELFLACCRDIYPIYRRGLGQSVYRAVERVIDAGSEESIALASLTAAHVGPPR